MTSKHTMSGVKVKPLEWVTRLPGSTMRHASTIIGSYRVWTFHGANTWFWQFNTETPCEVNSPSDGVEAAQADYNTRILAALAPSDAEPVGCAARDLADAVRKLSLEELVSGWHAGGAYERHPDELGVTLKTNCGTVYAIAAALKSINGGVKK